MVAAKTADKPAARFLEFHLLALDNATKEQSPMAGRTTID